MKFTADGPFRNADLAARKLVEIANGVEAVQDSLIFIERSFSGPVPIHAPSS